MESKTIQIGEKRVVVTETEDGFKAEEAEEKNQGTHIRFESNDRHGCEIPIDADFYYERRVFNDKPAVYWHESDDVSSLLTNPARKNTEKGGTEYSGGAIVTAEKTEIIHK